MSLLLTLLVNSLTSSCVFVFPTSSIMDVNKETMTTNWDYVNLSNFLLPFNKAQIALSTEDVLSQHKLELQHLEACKQGY